MAYDKVVDSAKLDAALLETANAIKEKTGTTEPIAFDRDTGFKSAVESIESGGGIDLMQYAENIPGFKNANFPPDTELTINIPRFSKGNVASLTLGEWNYTTGLKKLKLISNAEIREGITLSTSFNSSSIEELDLSEFPRWFKNILSGFMNCRNLKRVLGELDFTNCAFNGYEFYNCEALEELYIEEGTLSNSLKLAQSSKLIDISIQSIVEGFADMTEKTAPTLTVHATVGGKLTETQKATLTAKNVILVY